MKNLIALAAGLNFIAAAACAADQPALNALEFDSRGDGVTKDTAAIQAALDACTKAGGGTVWVPEEFF